MLPSYRKLLLLQRRFAAVLSGMPPAAGRIRGVRSNRARSPRKAGSRVRKANIRVDSTLVLIPVTVTDPLNRFVTGLDKENFKLFEDKQRAGDQRSSPARMRRSRSAWSSIAAAAWATSWRNRARR